MFVRYAWLLFRCSQSIVAYHCDTRNSSRQHFVLKTQSVLHEQVFTGRLWSTVARLESARETIRQWLHLSSVRRPKHVTHSGE
ncbi:hypothetical protein BJ546DRAFT_269977 [Cryomyces antarcticus]